MILVRRFEERIFELFAAGQLHGTTHGYVGQEANAVSILNHLSEGDIVVSNHRCHGHYLVRTGDVEGLMAELMGKASGVCGGRGGSQHLCNGSFYTNGVQGNIIPVAAGMAYAEKSKGTAAISVLFIGDGTLGQGVVYETFNLISLWSVPILVVIENNSYAQTTPLSVNFAGRFVDRAGAFGLSCGEIETTDVEELFRHFSPLFNNLRERGQPHVEIVHTYRLCAHSKGDDFRPRDEIDAKRKADPVSILALRLNTGRTAEIQEMVRQRIERGEAIARNAPFPDLKSLDHLRAIS